MAELENNINETQVENTPQEEIVKNGSGQQEAAAENPENLQEGESQDGEGEGGDEEPVEPVKDYKVLIALSKKRGSKRILVPSMEGYESGYNIDGIYVEKGGEARIFALADIVKPFGINSTDLSPNDKNYGKISQSIGGMDGEESTQTLIDIYYLEAGTACVDAKEYGWLPAGGELDLALACIEDFNAMCEVLECDPIDSGKYWLSQRRNANYAWFYDVEFGGYGSWLGGMDELKVRPVKSAEGYEEVGAE